VEEMKRDDLCRLLSKTFVRHMGMSRAWADVRADQRKTFVVTEKARPGLKLTKVLYGWLHALLGQPSQAKAGQFVDGDAVIKKLLARRRRRGGGTPPRSGRT
jgi:hypothetical protein